ncbi:UDP-N-acetyl-D-mannosamine dehydrogenase [Labrenzia sp. PHM005]|uniref:UDP-N-acetyl-D-mannosamine dehydrogenase n=1 Tax=Labrenzia sp. PHM005 TaxID=2590016 RepID=UPI00113FE7FB|nr:UDP-N-acetyl-D-mannosamine dehydrogenase [Labrenzia sp. PHM005]QDG76709.1 UDP-N-acetyl-D-mannosamine dehydrogenase [Labrenzia sp. PHM005]
MLHELNTISVIGLGYIGLPTAAILASSGKNVVGVDINNTAVTAINEGRAHFFEPELNSMVADGVQSGNLRAVNSPEAADAFIIAVPTPVSKGNVPYLGYIEAAANSIAPVLKSGDLIILESTSPVGTVEMMASKLAAARPDLKWPHEVGEAADMLVAYCPERIIPGRMMTELVENDRIIGGLSENSIMAATALYSSFARGKLVPTTGRTAEMVKLTENAYRDVNIAFANELSKVCDHFGIDAWEVIDLANHHPRVNILNPGPGVGGHCIAVDPWFIVHAADGLAPLMQTAREVNDSKPGYVVDKVAAMVQPGDKIACLGLAYKADTDDLRESPAIQVVEEMADAGIGQLLAVEPNVEALPSSLIQKGVMQSSLPDALRQCETIVLLVDHQAFKELDLSLLQGKRVYDSRGIWPQYRACKDKPAPTLLHTYVEAAE